MAKISVKDEELPSDKFRYSGPSMHPTFKPGEILYVQSEIRDIQPGDIVVYRRYGKQIVHRVVSVSSNGFLTRGDNNLAKDEQVVRKEEIIGVVVGKELWGNQEEVTGGKKGLGKAKQRWRLKEIHQKTLPLIGIPYRWLKRKGWVRKLWHPRIIKLKINSTKGEMIKYLFKGKVVAIWLTESGRFFCKRPFDLVIQAPQITHEK